MICIILDQYRKHLKPKKCLIGTNKLSLKSTLLVDNVPMFFFFRFFVFFFFLIMLLFIQDRFYIADINRTALANGICLSPHVQNPYQFLKL